MKSLLTGAALLVAGVSAHGTIVSPPARAAGPAMAAVCGADAVSNVNADPTIPLEDVFPSATTCKLNLCRGAVFEDNQNLVQTFAVGQVIPMKAEIPIPHEGPMNVSIVNTKTNHVIAGPLIEFDSYADEKLATLPANNTDFSITMPKLAAGQCTQPGDCVVQWFWFGTSAQQTYESCIDFVIGSGSAPAISASNQTACRIST